MTAEYWARNRHRFLKPRVCPECGGAVPIMPRSQRYCLLHSGTRLARRRSRAKPANKEVARIYSRAWRAAHPDAARIKLLKYRAKNPEKGLSRLRAWAAALSTSEARRLHAHRNWKHKTKRRFGDMSPELWQLLELLREYRVACRRKGVGW